MGQWPMACSLRLFKPDVFLVKQSHWTVGASAASEYELRLTIASDFFSCRHKWRSRTAVFPACLVVRAA